MAVSEARITLSRRGILRGAALLGAAAGTALTTTTRPAYAATLGPGDPALAAEVRNEFLVSWSAYRRLACGRDELRPLSGTGSEFFIGGTPLGLTIVESLDTLYLMELDAELAAGIGWIRDRFDVDRDASIHVFETIIRLVGGLLSGYHATGEPVLLDRARDLGDRLLPAFDSPTGAPYRYVNLRSGAVSGNQVPLAEIGSNITEFGYLSRLTGDGRYLDAAKRALRAVWDRRSGLNLVGTTLNVDSGDWTDPTARVDPPVDSFFEYLWDGYQFLGDRDCLDWYRTLTAAVLARLAETVNGRLWFKQADMHSGNVVGRGQSELTAFYAGLLAQGGNVAEGRRYHDSWAAVLDRYRLPPEAIDYPTLTARSSAYQLRPEYVDAALFLWLATGDELYRDRGRDMWNRQKAHCRVANGYAVVNDMKPTPTRKGDLTPGYWFSENMKYYYLLWAAAPRFDYADNYLTTEGNVLRGLLRRPPAPSTSFSFRNRAAGRVLEVRNSSLDDDGPIVLWADNGTPTQRWTVTTSGGYSTLTNANSGKVLEVPRSSVADGTALVQYTGNGTATQQWQLRPAGRYYTLVNRNSGKVAGSTGTGDGSTVVQQTADGSTGQQWELVQR